MLIHENESIKEWLQTLDHLRSFVIFYLCLFSNSVRLAYDILDHSALFPSIEYHSVSEPLAVIPIPLMPVIACEYVEQTS